MKYTLLAALLLLGLAGCVNVQATKLDRSVALAPLAIEEVVVYRTPDQVGRAYREVALLEANGNGDFTSERNFIESMRRKAAKLGANGVILEPGLEPGPLLRTAQVVLGVEYIRYRHAIAIVRD